MCKELEKANVLNEQFFGNFNHCNIPDVFSIGGCLVDAEFPSDYFCTEEEVFGLITSLDATKSTGADGISARMLKATALAITPSVTKLFNSSLKSGKFPVDWKFARIVPIPKSGDPTNPANYRPISILSILSKLLEKHVHQLLLHHLVSNNLLSPCPWGFTERKSTSTALLSFIHTCHLTLESGNDVCTVFYDLSIKLLIVFPTFLCLINFLH